MVGDAFGGVSVPWHLTTREAMGDVRRVLTPDGLYVANLIDHGSLAFARAEVATLREVFDHVVLAGEPPDVAADPRAGAGGNLVVLASDRELDLAAVQARHGRARHRLDARRRRRPRRLGRRLPRADRRLRAGRPAAEP